MNIHSLNFSQGNKFHCLVYFSLSKMFGSMELHMCAKISLHGGAFILLFTLIPKNSEINGVEGLK